MENQTMRYTESELDLMRETFKENLPLLKAMRKVFLQLDVSEEEQELLKSTMKGDVIALVRKAFLPTLDGDAPLGQVIDLMMTVDIVSKFPEEAINHLKAREIAIAYINSQLDVMAEIGIVSTSLNSLTVLREDASETYQNIVARNTIIMLVENQLRDINTLANQVKLTEEEQKEAMEKESNK